MKRLLLSISLLAQVLVFGWFDAGPSGPSFNEAGGPVSYFGTYFMDSLQHAGPVLMLALGFFLGGAARGIDLSLASLAALLACILSRFSPATLWTLGLPVGILAAAALGMSNGLLIRRRAFFLVPILSILPLAGYRMIALAIGPGGGNPPFLETRGYEWLGGFFGVLTLTLTLYLLTVAWQWIGRLANRRRRACGLAPLPGPLPPLPEWPAPLSSALVALTALAAALLFTASEGQADGSMLAGAEAPALAIALLAGCRFGRRAGSADLALLWAFNIAVLCEALRGIAPQYLPPLQSQAVYYATFTSLSLAALASDFFTAPTQHIGESAATPINSAASARTSSSGTAGGPG